MDRKLLKKLLRGQIKLFCIIEKCNICQKEFKVINVYQRIDVCKDCRTKHNSLFDHVKEDILENYNWQQIVDTTRKGMSIYLPRFESEVILNELYRKS